MSHTLLERNDELELFDQTLSALGEGNGGLVVVTGPAGIGKSSLIAKLADRASASSVLTLATICTPLEREFSFGVPLGLFERHLHTQSAERRAALLAGAAANTTPLFESRASGEGEQQLFPLLHGLYWLTANIASDSPLLITVDDARWADVSSLRFLIFLAQRIEELPVVLAVSFRPGEATGAQAGLLEQLLAVPAARHLEPRPLSDTAVTKLIRNDLTRATKPFCAACVSATGGNPFLVGELINALKTEGVAPTTDSAAQVSRLAPSSLRRSVLLRLGHLHGAAIALTKAIAVLGGDSDLRHAAELANLGPEDAEVAADALTGADILESTGRPRFVHPLIESAIYTELGARERGRLHRRAAERLAAEAARAERIATHLLNAPPEADPWVVETLLEAAHEARRRGSPDSAVAYLSRASDEPALRRSEVRLELGEAQLLAGLGEQAIETLREALELSDDPAAAARAHHALGNAQYAAAQLAEAAASYAAGADAAAGEEPELALRNEASLIAIGLLVPELHQQVTRRLPPAIEQVRGAELSSAGRAILASGALISVVAGEPADAALALATEALDDGRLIAEEGADSATVYSVSGALSCCGEFDRSAALLDAAIEDARRTGSVMAYATAIYSRGHPNLGRGRLVEAVADIRAALNARQFGWRQFLPVANMFLILSLVERAETDQAREVVAEASKEDWDADLSWTVMFWARGALHLATGDPASALDDFRTWGARWQVPNPAFYAEWRSHAAVAAATLGDREQAIELASEELALVRGFGSPRSTGIAQRALGLAQRGDQGVETLRSAVESLADSEAQLERCRATVDLGGALRRSRHRAEARETLKVGLDLAHRMGATALEHRALEELKLAGGRPRKRTLSGVESLSPGELRVARMAAEGMSNREIAQALFVTPKAVQWHLTNTYRKLTITSREQIGPALSARPS